MSLKLAMLEMVCAPNAYGYVSDNSWQVIGDNATTLWAQLYTVDSLSERRYIPAVGAVLRITFPRADLPGTTATSRSIVKTATLNSDDRSLFSIAITAVDATAIVGGSVSVELTEGSSKKTWIQNWAVRKTSNTVGS